MSKTTCAYCCATYDIHEKACPYCGSYNEAGMEEHYLKTLHGIEKDLNNMESYVADSYVKEAKSVAKKIIVPVIVIIVVIFALYGLFYYETEIKYKNYQKLSLAWEEENFPIIDKMYEEGDYDGVAEFMHEAYLSDEKGVSFAFWDHADFMNAYDMHTYLLDDRDYIDECSESFKKSEKELTVCYCMALLYDSWDEKLSNGRINKKEYAMILEYQDEARTFMKKYFGVDDTDIYKQDVIFDPPGIGIDYSKCDKLADKLEWK